MAIGEIISVLSSVLGAFIIGAVGVLLLGSKTTLNFILVKISRGKKILVFARSSFGWVTEVALKSENMVKWKHHKLEYITEIKDDKDVTRYGTVDCCYVDLKLPTQTITIKDGAMYPTDFDPQVYNNLLNRAITMPRFDTSEKMKNLIMINIVIGIITIFFIVMTYVKLNNIVKLVSGGVI